MHYIARPSVWLSTFLCGALAAQDDAVRIEAMPGPVSQCWGNPDGGWVHAGRIVDALTGLPIPGAALYQVPERDRPKGGEFWFDRKWEADRDGFVRVRQQEAGSGSWFVVAATGYGPVAGFEQPPDGGDNIILLVPGIDWPVTVHDAMDQPLAGVEVGLCLGCGHTPDVRVATTDQRGLAVLRDVEPTAQVCGMDTIRDLYLRRAGLAPDYHDNEPWQLGDPPTLLRQKYATPASGRVLGPNGRPLAGVAIKGDSGYHRGPWVWSGVDGRFVLLGNDSERLQLYLDWREYQARMPASGQALDLVLPATELPQLMPKGRVAVVVRDAQSGRPLARAALELWHVGIQSKDPAEATKFETDADGVATAEVVAGRLGLRASAFDAATHDPETRDLEVAADGQLRVAIALTPRPRIRLRLHEGVRYATLVTRSGEYPIDVTNPEVQVPVPGREPFALRIDTDERHGERYYTFTAPPTGPVELRPYPPTRVRLRAIDVAGQPVAAEAWLTDRSGDDPDKGQDLPKTDAHGTLELTTASVGCAFVNLRPTGPGHRPCEVHLGLAQRGEDRLVDLGDVVLQKADAPALRVLRADGSASRGSVTLLRRGLRVGGELAEDGGWDGLVPQAGDRVCIAFEAAADEGQDGQREAFAVKQVRLAVQLSGAGPWTLRQGSGRLVFDVEDDFGLRPRNGAIVFGEQSFPTSGRLELRGLPAGELELFVGAADCDSARVRLHLGGNQERTVKVVLHRPQ